MHPTVKLAQTLRPEQIFLDAALPDKPAVLRFAADAFAESGIATDADRLIEALQAREAVMSTGIGNGLALPHAFTPEVTVQGVLLLRLARPIPFAAIDHQPVDVVLALVAPESGSSSHLQMLAAVSKVLRDADAMCAIRTADSADAILTAVRQVEERFSPS